MRKSLLGLCVLSALAAPAYAAKPAPMPTQAQRIAALEAKLQALEAAHPELLTPDSSRFWPADRYQPGRGQPSFDKQPLRDYLASLKATGRWNGEAPPPSLPAEVVDSTSRRYLEAYQLLTGHELSEDL